MPAPESLGLLCFAFPKQKSFLVKKKLNACAQSHTEQKPIPQSYFMRLVDGILNAN